MQNKIKKIWMTILALTVISWVSAFIVLNDQAYCADGSVCTPTQFTQTGTILPYSESEMLKALERGDKLAFLFQAPRCANCKLLKEDLYSKGIPAGATLLIADFDQASDLRSKYAVKNLHTIVLVDQYWNLVSEDESGEYQNLITLLQ